MVVTKKTKYWAAWLLFSMFIGVLLGNTMLTKNADKTIFMPGKLSPGHHQLTEKCQACHTDAFGGSNIIQNACVDCHGMDRVKPYDSHPAKKFKDPRNADLLASINALQCISCHTEHKPDITAKDGLTQPVDVCFHCHQEIAEELVVSERTVGAHVSNILSKLHLANRTQAALFALRTGLSDLYPE